MNWKKPLLAEENQTMTAMFALLGMFVTFMTVFFSVIWLFNKYV